MKKWIRAVSMCSLSLLILFLSPVMTTTTVHAGMVLAEGEASVPEVKLNVQAKSMVTDSTFNLRVYNLTETQKVSYKSGNTDIASVSRNGLITAKAVGETTITVTVKDSSIGTSTTLTCDIKVGPPATSIVLTLDKLTLEVGKKASLKTIIKPHNTAEVAAFYSLNPEIATVSATGKVTAKAAGEVTIYAEIASGDFSKCVITVVEASEETDAEKEGAAEESTAGTEASGSMESSKTTTQ